MFIAALFIIARTWKQPRCSSTDEWIKKQLYIYAMEYYSAIKRNGFESVIMRWMKLEPIIQSKVSQKEKYKYRILTHIFGIWRDGTDEYIFRVAMEKWTQRTDLWTRWEERREKGRCMERVTEICNTTCKTDSQWEFAVWLREFKHGLCNRLKGGVGREMGGRGHGCTYGCCLLMYDRKPPNSVQQLSFNLKI